MKEFDARRAKLFETLPENSVVLIFSGVSKIISEDEFYPFYPNRDFFYLTGIEQENSTLMLIKCPGERKEYLFLDEYNELKERWTGKRLSFDVAGEISQIENIYSNNNFEIMLSMALTRDNNIYGDIKNLFIDLSEATRNTQVMIEKEEDKKEKILEKSIEEMELSVRSFNCLKRAGINTVGELAQKTPEEMMRVRNLGRKSLKEVNQKLHEIGLDLRHSYDGDYLDLDENDNEEDELDDAILENDNVEENSTENSNGDSMILEMEDAEEEK